MDLTRRYFCGSCRETGDHGPINSWDRNAFISDVKYGTASYEAQMNHVDHNMIIVSRCTVTTAASDKLLLLTQTMRLWAGQLRSFPRV